MRLGDRGYLAPLHGLFELFERLVGDQPSWTALVHPAEQKLFESAFPASGEPPLALAPAVAQSPCRVPQGAALSRLQESSQHLHSVKQVAVAMVLSQFL